MLSEESIAVMEDLPPFANKRNRDLDRKVRDICSRKHVRYQQIQLTYCFYYIDQGKASKNRSP